MSLIRPFAGLRPAPEHVAGVIAPPYDVLSSDEARVRAAGKPFSFLHVSKPEIDLPPTVDVHDPRVYEQGRRSFGRMLESGVLRRDAAPYYYFYRLVMGTHTQTGLVAAASCAAYETGRIRRHEHTRPDKEDDRVRQIEALNAQTGPVFLTYRHSAAIDAIARAATASTPDMDVTADDNVRHSLWVVSRPERIAALTEAFEALERLYIADGHHRSAAAARVAERRRVANAGHTGAESYNYFLAVIFPDDQMRILDYNRVVKDLNGLSPQALLARLDQAFEVSPEAEPVRPARAGEFGMYLAGRWYRLRVKPDRVPARDPVGRLDVSVLQDQLLTPVLGVGDPRRDRRIDFVGGIRGLSELVKRVDSGEVAVAFALCPTSLADLMAVADTGAVMPPKSTWFEPKLADGVVSHVLD
ncbi:SpoOJ/ParA/ParB/repB family protein [Sulfurifustis variabilis]|uniref:SpoOJ/ParA/ParB/repB family protein n=1 Tax=Sulfurifustis variabilis TaxID=1675686 RepID=A0A1B4VE57_9GAMM|nr:DUF1015 family protein [Sulfurifustis variabilis]BAU48907.1 SpoOJ/ParA/ParB/repB family protein [Sulfurifustis variabilis]